MLKRRKIDESLMSFAASRPSVASHARLALLALATLCAAVALFALAAASASAAVPNICTPGSAAGKCGGSQAVAVDQSSGEVYVADAGNHRIDVFDSSGHFLRAFGFGVRDGAKELETCTTLCIRGRGTNGGPGEAGPLPGAINPNAIAVDTATHDVYAFDALGNRIETYTPSGEFLLMVGGGVDQGPHHPGNLCTAAYIAEGDTCGAGSVGSGPAQFSLVKPGLAVDSSGNLWVGDNNRVEEFSAAGAYLSEVALPGEGSVGSLAVDPSGDLYAANGGVNEEQKITPPGSGTYTLSFEGQTTEPIAFNASFEQVLSALKKLSTIGAGSLSVGSFAQREVLFIGPLGDADVPQLEISSGLASTIQEGVPSTLRKFNPSGEPIASFDGFGHPSSLSLDPATGNLWVSDLASPTAGAAGRAVLLEFNPAGEEVAAFGSGEVIGSPYGGALAFASTAQRLYVASSSGGEENSAVQPFPLPAPGPLPVAGTAKADPIAKLSASLCSRVNPEHAETKAHFQYISAAQFKTNEAEGHEGFTGATRAPAGPAEDTAIPADFSFAHELCQPISGLLPATGYRFRVVANNTNGTVSGETASFETLPPAAIDFSGASGVSADSATLEAEINPLGDETSYHFEYITAAKAEENEATSLPPFSGAAQAPLQPAQIGKGSADVSLSQHLQGLAPGTVYRYRAVVRNQVSEEHPPVGQEDGDFAGPASTFTTQSPAAGAGLPDNRAWEQVSPPDKHGAAIKPLVEGPTQAAADGNAFAFITTAPTEAEPEGYAGDVSVLAGRGPSGWPSRDLTPPHSLYVGVPFGFGEEYRAFSTDLSLGAVQPFGPLDQRISPAASEPTAFLRADFAPGSPSAICANGEGCYRPLVTGCPASGECPAAVHALADVLPGTVFGAQGKIDNGRCRDCGPQFLSATPDFAHIVLFSEVALTPGGGLGNALYEWSAASPPADALHLLSVQPSGLPFTNGPLLGAGDAVLRNAISTDGSRVVFEAGGNLYLRTNANEGQSAVSGGSVDGSQCTEVGKGCTIQLDAIQGGFGASDTPAPHFQTSSADGSRVFFTDTQKLTADAGGGSKDAGDLYECRIVEVAAGLRCDLADLTPETGGEAAGVLGTIPGASADGSYVYFVAQGALATGASPGDCSQHDVTIGGEPVNHGFGSCNLYLRHEGRTTFIATLAGEDMPDWSDFSVRLDWLTARVSPDGRWLAFMSDRPLTGYDNRDARQRRTRRARSSSTTRPPVKAKRDARLRLLRPQRRAAARGRMREARTPRDSQQRLACKRLARRRHSRLDPVHGGTQQCSLPTPLPLEPGPPLLQHLRRPRSRRHQRYRGRLSVRAAEGRRRRSAPQRQLHHHLPCIQPRLAGLCRA